VSSLFLPRPSLSSSLSRGRIDIPHAVYVEPRKLREGWALQSRARSHETNYRATSGDVCGRNVHFEERRVRILVKLVCAQDVGFAQRIDSGIRREHRKKRPDKRPTINPIEQQIAFEPSDISRCLSLVISPKIRVPVLHVAASAEAAASNAEEGGAAIFTKRALRQRGNIFFAPAKKFDLGTIALLRAARGGASFLLSLPSERDARGKGETLASSRAQREPRDIKYILNLYAGRERRVGSA